MIGSSLPPSCPVCLFSFDADQDVLTRCGVVLHPSCAPKLNACVQCQKSLFQTSTQICLGCKFEVQRLPCSSCKTNATDGIMKGGKFVCTNCEESASRRQQQEKADENRMYVERNRCVSAGNRGCVICYPGDCTHGEKD